MSVDVVIISQGQPEPLHDTLRFLAAQSHHDWRALVVPCRPTNAPPAAHASSTDPAASLAAAVDRFNLNTPPGPRGPRAHLVNTPPAPTQGAAFAAGAAHCRADDVMLLHAGDRPLRRGIDRLIAAARLSGHGAACGPVAIEHQGERRGGEIAPPQTGFGLFELLDGHDPAPAGMLLARSLLESKKIAAPLGLMAITDLCLRLAEDGVRWLNCGGVVALVPCRSPGPASAWPALADEAQRVISRAYARAAARGWDEAELSPQREADAIADAAMVYATMSALSETDPRLPLATQTMRGRTGEHAIDAHDAASAAAQALRLMPALEPNPTPTPITAASPRAWTAPLHRWWSRCVSERWAQPGLSGRALAELAALLTPDHAVAAALINQLGMPGTLLVTGSDAPAFAVADAAAAKGWTVGLIPGSSPRLAQAIINASGDRYFIADHRAAADTRDPLLIGPELEDQALERFASRPNVLRWTGTQRALIAEAEHALRAAWPRRGESADLEPE